MIVPLSLVATRLPAPSIESAYFRIKGGRVHYLRSGKGPTLILLHGFPQDASEFRKIIPALARRFTVVAPDLRGIGGSTTSLDRFDPASLASDVRQLVVGLELGNAYVFGNDIGGPVGYAYARLYPKATRGLMLVESPLIGMPVWKRIGSDPRVWHATFMQMPRLPEALITGRQFVYFREQFFGTVPPKMPDAEVRRYARAYASKGQLHAGLGVYRAFPAQARFNLSHKERFDVPFVVAGGSKVFGPFVKEMAEGFRAWGCTNVTSAVLPNCRHYIADENPALLAAFIEKHATATLR